MAMTTALRNKILGSVSAGAIAVATVMIAGTNGKDGLEGVEYKPYQDVVGVWTVCYGHTGKDIILNRTYTEQECRAMLDKDLRKVAAQVDPLIRHRLPDSTRGALYSFAYNVGAGAFRSSTLLTKINQGDTAGACEQLKRWIYAGGQKWKGLMNRRDIEREVCMWGANA